MNLYKVLAILTPSSRSVGITGRSGRCIGRLLTLMPSMKIFDLSFRNLRYQFFNF